MNNVVNKIFPIYSAGLTQSFLRRNLDIEFIPYTQCNLKCDFCEVQQFHYKYDQSIFDWTIEALDALISKSQAESISLHIAGGEIFFDKIFDYQKWDNWINQFCLLCNKYNKTNTITITSNLLTRNIDNVIKLCKTYNIQLDTSFDFEGRFTKYKQVELWWNNLQKTKALNPLVVIIAHKLNIQAILSENHPLFKLFQQLYQNFEISFEPYVDANQLAKYVVNDDQLINFYKHLIDYWPKITTVQKYTNNQTGKGCSFETIDITPKYVQWSCCDKNASYKTLMHKFNCWTCDYKSQCKPNCPNETANHYQCIGQALYEYVSQNNSNCSGK